MRLLDITDADEVSPVKRGANRKGLVLKGDEVADDEITDIMSVPWEREGAMIDEIRKAGGDETDVKAAVGAMRLLTGVADNLPPEMQEAITKLGTELYAPKNPPLNTSDASAVPGMNGQLEGEGTSGGGQQGKAGGAAMDGGASGPDRDGKDSAPKVNKKGKKMPWLDDDDKDAVDKDDNSFMSEIDSENDDDQDDDVDKAANNKPYGNVTYADPGYQSDGKKRYPIDTEEHVRAAWSYINKPANSGKYSSSQAAAIKSRIRGAMKRVGADVAKADEALAEELAEAGVALPDGWNISRLKKAFRKSQDVRPTTPDDPSDGSNTVPDVNDPDDKTIAKGGQVEAHEVPIQKADGEWDFTGVPAESRTFYETVLKSQAETVTKLAKAETELAETREELRTKEIIAKAEKEFKHLGARDDVVEVLKAASEKLDAEGYEKLVTLLSTSDERIAKGDLFTELGRSGIDQGGGGGDAWDKIEKAADALVEKSGEITHEQAVDRILKTAEGKKLYNQYLVETGIAG